MGARLAGGGIGTTAIHAVKGYYRNGLLKKVLCGSYQKTDIPPSFIHSMGLISRIIRRIAIYDSKNWVDYVYRLMYDQWATRYVKPSIYFQGWSGYSSKTIKTAKSFGSITILDRSAAHPLVRNNILSSEYHRLGYQHRWPKTISFILEEIRIADYIFIPSDFVRQNFIDEGVTESKLIQIPYGVDVEKFKPNSGRRKNTRFIVLFVGQVSFDKGVHILLDVWRKLNWQNAELWLAGRINLPRKFLESSKTLPNVRFLGHVNNIVEIYQQADVFVFPSLAEGSALVNYEAMACGLPVITTPNAGSVVRDGVDGFIETYSNVDNIATRLELLRSDNGLRNEMGNSGREHVQSYTWHQYGERVAQAIKNLS